MPVLIGESHQNRAANSGLEVLLGRIRSILRQQRCQRLPVGLEKKTDRHLSKADPESSSEVSGVFEASGRRVGPRHGDTDHSFGTERLYGPPLATADKLLRTITGQTRLPCSAGLASTRLVAKVASDQGKPRGLVWVVPGMEARFLAPLPIRKIPGIGEVTERALRALSGDAYEFLIDAEPKSISHNHTFGEDTSNIAEMETMLSHLSQKACKRLREAGLFTRTLTLTIRYAGFQTYTRSKTVNEPVHLDADIFRIFLDLFRTHLDPKRKVRLLGTALSQFTHGSGQLELLDADRRGKLDKLTQAADRLRDKFGFGSVQFGGSLRRDDS